MIDESVEICVVNSSDNALDEFKELQSIVAPEKLHLYHERKLSKELFTKYKNAVFVVVVQSVTDINYKDFEGFFPSYPVLIAYKNHTKENLDVLYNSKLQTYIPYTNSFFEHLLVSVIATKQRVVNNKKNVEEYNEYKSLIDAIRGGTIDALGAIEGNQHKYVKLFGNNKSNIKDPIPKKLEYLANFDRKTGLPNSDFINEYLKLEMSKASSNDIIGVVAFKIHNFAEINSRYGLETAEKFLGLFCNKLVDSISINAMPSRYMYNIFVIIFTDVDEISQIIKATESMSAVMQDAIVLDFSTIYPILHVGISIFPDDSTESTGLIDRAISAIEQVTTQGSNNFSFYDVDSNKIQKRRALISSSIEEACKNDHFHLCFQPIVLLANGEHLHYEALLRWEHPTLGSISPVEFIPIAENFGHINLITSWVVNKTCSILAQIRYLGKSFKPIAINLSGLDFTPEVVAVIQDNLQRYNLDPSHVHFEMTETAFAYEHIDVEQQIIEIKKLGFKIALDDFGKGYSSLSRLYNIQFDYIKIDGSFVKNLKENDMSYAIIESIIYIAHKFNIKIIAECIETEEQKNILKRLGAEYGQGYFFSKPLPIENFI